jgi:hypothetical protein
MNPVSDEPNPPPAFNGDSAAWRSFANPLEAALITPTVFDCRETNTARIATPMIAVITVTTEVIKESVIVLLS